MNLYPQTLLSRTVFIVLLILVLSQFMSNMLVHHLIIKPRAQQRVMTFGENLQSIHSALLALPNRQRFMFVKYLANKQHFVVTDDHERILKLPRLVEYSQFHKLLSDYLPAPPGKKQLDIRHEKGEKRHRYWVHLPVGEHNYWIGFSASRVRSSLHKELMIWLSCTLVFALIGSYWLATHIKRSLKVLSEAARRIGQGEQIENLPEQGPREICLLTRAFNKMHHDIELLTRNRTLLLAGVSHDLRTPLARMRLSLEMLKASNLVQTRDELVQDIEDMDNILEQFLVFVREGGEEVVVRTDLNALITTVVERYSHSDIVFELDLATDLPKVMVQPIAIQRVLINLIDNASKYAASSPVSITTRVHDDKVEIAISDRGPGIPAHERNRLLEPFTQLNEGRKSAGGTGLGLAIAKRIIGSHRGHIRLGDSPGGGLLIMIEFPTGTPPEHL
jgi:two-component system osmolarity sensor histidine kinase EnvZ